MTTNIIKYILVVTRCDSRYEMFKYLSDKIVINDFWIIFFIKR